MKKISWLWWYWIQRNKDVKKLFDLSIDAGYYKPITTNNTFNSNYVEYESNGDKNKTLSIKEYLNMIRPYLRDIINDHKFQVEWKVHSGNEVINYKTQKNSINNNN